MPGGPAGKGVKYDRKSKIKGEGVKGRG